MGSPLRVLHVVVNMNRGGAETLIMNLYRNMDRTKVQFDFLTCKEGVYDQEIIGMGGIVYRIPYVTDVGHRQYMRALKQFFMDHTYHIVHSHMDKMSGIVIREAKKASIPIRIAHSHSTASEGGIVSRVYKHFAGNYIGVNQTHMYACSCAAADWLFKKKSEAATILKNGIEVDTFQFNVMNREDKRRALNIPDDAVVFGHVGRFYKPKNHSYLIDLFRMIHQQLTHKAVLVLIGDGPLREAIQAQVNALHLNDKVKFLGVRNDIPDLLQALDIFVFPSLHEGLPVTLIEAQGAGLPCFISNTITSEVDLGLGLIHSLPLDDGSAWMKAITPLCTPGYSRIYSSKALTDYGYNIRHTAAELQSAYLSYGSDIHETAHNIHSYV